jgi:[protein]-arginine 3-hydroxylase / protease
MLMAYLTGCSAAASSCITVAGYLTNNVVLHVVQVDVNAPDPESVPLFMRVPYSECTLKEGDILYIPRRWWHFVRAETPSISVNYWWTVPS